MNGYNRTAIREDRATLGSDPERPDGGVQHRAASSTVPLMYEFMLAPKKR